MLAGQQKLMASRICGGLTLDGIAVGEGGFEAVEEFWHCVLALLVTVLEYGLGS